MSAPSVVSMGHCVEVVGKEGQGVMDSFSELRDRIYRWALHKHNLETKKLTVFLEKGAAFPFCDWSIKRY